jgi:hypothetical protein
MKATLWPRYSKKMHALQGVTEEAQKTKGQKTLRLCVLHNSTCRHAEEKNQKEAVVPVCTANIDGCVCAVRLPEHHRWFVCHQLARAKNSASSRACGVNKLFVLRKKECRAGNIVATSRNRTARIVTRTRTSFDGNPFLMHLARTSSDR